MQKKYYHVYTVSGLRYLFKDYGERPPHEGFEFSRTKVGGFAFGNDKVVAQCGMCDDLFHIKYLSFSTPEMYVQQDKFANQGFRRGRLLLTIFMLIH